MKLFISEKPSVNKAIAEYYSKRQGVPLREVGKTLFVGDDVFIALAGHVLRNKDVVEYNDYADFKWTQLGRLPIIPEPFELAPNFDVKEGKKDFSRYEGILKGVKYHLDRADEVINVGDTDDEGQLLVDEVIEYFGYRGPVNRLWTSGLTDQYLDKSFANIKPNENYYAKGLAAKARSHTDWIHGINFTILMSVLLHKQQKQMVMTPTGTKVKSAKSDGSQIYSIGRVQTPVLNLVYERELENKNFVPIDFFTFGGLVTKNEQDMKVTLDLKNQLLIQWLEDRSAINTNGQLVSKDVAEEIVSSFVVGRNYPVTKAETTDKKEAAPLALSLAELLKECSKRFGLTVEETQNIANDLYLKKYITYPRNKDCRHLTEDEFDNGPMIVGSLQNINNLVDVTEKSYSLVDLSYRGSKVWNNKEVAKAAHPAIVPTGELDSNSKYEALSEKHQQVFSVVAQYYLYQFMKPASYKQFNGVISHDSIERLKLLLNGRQWLDRSWKDAYSVKDEVDESENALPALSLQDSVMLSKFELNARKTTRPPLFNDASLLDAMINAYHYVKDESLRDVLKGKSENNTEEYSVPVGIGTDSTRATIIETLFKRNYINKDPKGYLTTTDKAKELLESIPVELRWVDLTAELQQILDDLRSVQIDEYRLSYNNVMNAQKIKIKELFLTLKDRLIEKTGYQERVITPLDMDCSCCDGGKIVKSTYSFNGEQKEVVFCQVCNRKFDFDNEGGLVERIYRETDFQCSKCESKLIEKKGFSKNGIYHFFSCSNKDCKEIYSIDENGNPTKGSKFPLTDFECANCKNKLHHIKFDKTQSDGAVKHINMFACDKCETTYSSTSEDTPKYPVFLSEPCPYCGGKVEHLKGVNKEGKPYNFGRCKTEKCKGNLLSLDSSDKIMVKVANKSCPACGGKVIYTQLPNKKEPTKPFHLYTCQNAKCGVKYWGTKDDFKNPFEPHENKNGNTEQWLKEHRCEKCKHGYIKKVTYSAAVAASKQKDGYYQCSDGQCGVFYNVVDGGFELSKPKEKKE